MDITLFISILLLASLFASLLGQKLWLPRILGMILAGILLSVLGLSVDYDVSTILSIVSGLAIVCILFRAGMGIEKEEIQKQWWTAVALALIPCFFEIVVLTLILFYGFGFDIFIAGMTASIISAVSPAIIVPSMLRLIGMGYKKIPNLVLASASLDDIVAITSFSVFFGFALWTNGSVLRALWLVPVEVVLGVFLGVVVWRLMYKTRSHMVAYSSDRHSAVIFFFLLVLIYVLPRPIWINTLIAIMVAWYFYAQKSSHQSLLASKEHFHFVRIGLEVFLFWLIGYMLNIQTTLERWWMWVLVVFCGILARSLGVLLATSYGHYSHKERFFVVFAFLPKATVQAVLWWVALIYGLSWGDQILSLSVISILLTAPLWMLLINHYAPILLQKKK